MRGDPLIIGGGPAGAAAAITLARGGHRPILIERSFGPTDKVCGDFLSADTIQLLSSLGLDPAGLGAAPIEMIRLINGQRTAEAALPFRAFGLSRRTLDAALLRQAQRTGADIRTGQTVRHISRHAGQWAVQIGGNEKLAARTVFLATGKHDLRDRPRPGAADGAIGMKMYFTLRPGPMRTLERTTELTLFPGGYAGLQPVENDQAVLCVAVQRHAFQRYGGNWSGLLAAIGQSSSRFASMLNGATPSLARPLAIANVPYGYRATTATAESLFRLGDQAAVIASLTGDGMAIALHSGQASAETFLAGGDAVAYHATLSRTLAAQMRLAGLLHQACMSGPVQAIAIRVAAVFPALLRHAATRTRLSRTACPNRTTSQPIL